MDRAGDKATICVSAGDLNVAPMSINRIAVDAQMAVGREALRLSKAEVDPGGGHNDAENGEPSEAELESTRRIVDKALESSMEEMGRALIAAHTRRMRTYELATEYDSASALAWSRLATSGEPAKRLHAARTLGRLQPSNALPHYLEAEAAVLLEAGEDEEVLMAVEEGNRQPTCVFPKMPWPDQADGVRYPACAACASQKKTGDPVPRRALREIAEGADVRASMEIWQSFRNLARHMHERSQQKGEGAVDQHSVRYLEAIARMGCQVIRSRPHDVVTVLTGVAIVRMSMCGLRLAYADPQHAGKLKRVEQLDASLSALFNEIRADLDRRMKGDLAPEGEEGKQDRADDRLGVVIERLYRY